MIKKFSKLKHPAQVKALAKALKMNPKIKDKPEMAKAIDLIAGITSANLDKAKAA